MRPNPITVAIACGGTGGHLFPGLAVAEEFLARGGAVTLLISPKDVDQQAVRAARGVAVVTLPAVGLNWRRVPRFAVGFLRSWRVAQDLFRTRPHQAVLGMGGFTAAPVLLAGRRCGAATFLHESNVVPGRANRLLAPRVDGVFLAFAEAATRLRAKSVAVTGTPVRPQFQPGSPEAARVALGLEANRPVLLITGGSQGARAVNEAVVRSLPLLQTTVPELQFLHLTGPADFETVRAAHAAAQTRAVVRPFLTEMELALGAATVAISRAGGSSLAELAAMQVPAILVPYPFAADDHQFHNARVLAGAGAACLLPQPQAVPELLTPMVADLVRDPARRARMKQALAGWHRPGAAARIAELVLEELARRNVGEPALETARKPAADDPPSAEGRSPVQPLTSPPIP